MKLYKLTDMIVFCMKGNAVKFLNGLTSNTLEAPFNAFVNQHGRILTTFRQQKISDDEVLIALPALAVEVLLTHLKMYARISGTVIETTRHKVYVDLQTEQWLFDEADLPAEVSEDEFTAYRVEHNLPLQGVDYYHDEFILNVDSGQFVSFTKGCFLGQEPVAKVHNRSKPSKKLIVKTESDCSDEEKAALTSKIKDPKTGVVKGFVFVKS